MEEIVQLQRDTAARTVDFVQCAPPFNGRYQKATTLMYTADMPRLAELAELRCTHKTHEKVARGRVKGKRRKYQSAEAAAYPAAMNHRLVNEIAEAHPPGAGLTPRGGEALGVAPRAATPEEHDDVITEDDRAYDGDREEWEAIEQAMAEEGDDFEREEELERALSSDPSCTSSSVVTGASLFAPSSPYSLSGHSPAVQRHALSLAQ